MTGHAADWWGGDHHVETAEAPTGGLVYLDGIGYSPEQARFLAALLTQAATAADQLTKEN